MKKQNLYSEKEAPLSGLKSPLALVLYALTLLFLLSPVPAKAANTNECPSSVVDNGSNSITINYASAFGSTITSVTITVSGKGTAVYSGSTITNVTASSVKIISLASPTSGPTTITSSDNATLVTGDGTDTKTCTTSTPLPVKLTRFTATFLAGNKTQLNWVTASELNNDRFEIEKSTNGKDFELIGTVKGFGNSNQLIHYEFVDNEFNYTEAINAYYRLRQVDYDGNFEYSPIIIPKPNRVMGNKPQMVIYPNPANSSSVITVDLKNLGLFENKVQVTDIHGKIVYETNSYEPSNFLEVENLPVGSYNIIVNNRYSTLTKKLVVQD